MLQRALKLGLIVVVLGLATQDVQAGRHHGWGGCGYGGCGYGGYYGGYGGWYGGYGGGYGWGPGAYFGSSPAAPATNRALVKASQANGNSVVLTVSVPADAKVVINGHTTTSTGETRQYTSTGLLPAAVYRFQVRAEFVRDGKPVSEEQAVDLTTGQTRSIAFKAAPEATVADVATAPQR